MVAVILVDRDRDAGTFGIGQTGSVLYALSPCCNTQLKSSETDKKVGVICMNCDTLFPAFKAGKGESTFKPTCNLEEVVKGIPEKWVQAVLNNPDAKVGISWSS